MDFTPEVSLWLPRTLPCIRCAVQLVNPLRPGKAVPLFLCGQRLIACPSRRIDLQRAWGDERCELGNISVLQHARNTGNHRAVATKLSIAHGLAVVLITVRERQAVTLRRIV